MSERQESGRTSLIAFGVSYPVALGTVSIEFESAEVPANLHRDGRVFARSALAAVQAEIDTHDDYREREIAAWVDDIFTEESAIEIFARMKERLRQLEWERDRLLAGGLAHRPPRKMPTRVKLAAYHGLPDKPSCVRCWFEPEDATWRKVNGQLQMAHIVDRVYDGLDLMSNLLPICVWCHRQQPIFKPGDEARALAWFLG